MTTTATPAVQEQILDGIRQSQQAVLEAVRAWTEATEKLAPNVPTTSLPQLPVDVPSPKEAVENAFDLAEKLLANQREFVQELIAAVPAPAASTNGTKAKAKK